MRLSIIALICMFILISSVSLYGGHPLITDDATIVDDKACQIESWMEREFEERNFLHTSGLQFHRKSRANCWGRGTHEAHRTRHSRVVIQGKSISSHWKPMDGALDWLRVRYGIQKAARIIGHISFRCLPASFSFKDDRIIVNGNLGWNRNSAERGVI